MKDQKGESGDVEAALEIIHSEQDKEYLLKVSEDTLYNLSGLLLVEEVAERRIYTDPRYTNHISPEDFQEKLGPTLLEKFANATEFGEDELGKMSISLCYREVNALALVSLGRPFEEKLYGSEFWKAVFDGKLDSNRMIEQGRFSYPRVLECAVSFVDAGGKDQYNLRGVFERLTKIGYRKKGDGE